MLIGSLPDMHLMERSPKKRKDKMKATSLSKFDWCLSAFEMEGIEFVGAPGDLFDTATASYDFTGEVIQVIRNYQVRILAVAGQHDLRYHTRGIKNTPIGLLLASGLIEIPTIDNPITIDGRRVFGAGWGDEQNLRDLISSGEDVSEDILLIHRTIVKDKEMFKGQANFSASKSFMKNYPFKIILSGDNHERFIQTFSDRVLVNGGSIIRLEKGQIDYEPHIHFIDTDTMQVTFAEVPIEPDIFDEKQLEEDDAKARRKEKLEKLINIIKADTRKVSFPEILHSVTEQSKPSKRQRDLLDDIMEEAKEMI